MQRGRLRERPGKREFAEIQRQVARRVLDAALLVDEDIEAVGAGAADDAPDDRLLVAARLVDLDLRQHRDAYRHPCRVDPAFEAARLRRRHEPAEIAIDPDAGIAQRAPGVVEAAGPCAVHRDEPDEQQAGEHPRERRALPHLPASTCSASFSSMLPRPVRPQIVLRS